MTTRTANADTTELDPYLTDLAGQVYPPDLQCTYLQGDGAYLLRVSLDTQIICLEKHTVIRKYPGLSI